MDAFRIFLVRGPRVGFAASRGRGNRPRARQAPITWGCPGRLHDAGARGYLQDRSPWLDEPWILFESRPAGLSAATPTAVPAVFPERRDTPLCTGWGNTKSACRTLPAETERVAGRNFFQVIIPQLLAQIRK
jgi:hypothetical protein